jgi:hypothetical protein
MKATYQWDFAATSCLSEMSILRAREVNALPKPPTPGQLVSEVPPAGAMNTAPQICNGCKESKILAIAGRMAQSVSHDLRNHLTAIYSNVEFMSGSRTTNVEREELLEEVRAVIHDMTGMLDSLLLLAKTGQPLHPCWGSLNEVVEHAAYMVRAHPDARNVEVVIQNVTPVACWMDSTNLAALFITYCLTPARRRGSDSRRDGSESRLPRTNGLFISRD